MTNEPKIITVADLKAYLNKFPDTAIVQRYKDQIPMEGAYVSLDVAMDHIEQTKA